MASDKSIADSAGARIFSNPWPASLLGLGAAGIGALVYQITGSVLVPLIILGPLSAGVAIAIRPGSPAVLGFAAVTGFMVCFALLPSWDSIRMFMLVLSATAALAAVLMLLPRTLRRVAFSLIIIFHFGGILSSAFSQPPAPAVVQWAWTYVYRPYLEFMYLTNAYHFYSPEPGPGDLVWFYVKFEDGSADWFKIPRREDNALAVEYQRRLSLTQAVNGLTATPFSEEAYKRRLLAINTEGIPAYPKMDAMSQYRVPNALSKEMLRSFARYVTYTKAHETEPPRKVASVKIYRLLHNFLQPQELADGMDPDSLWLYSAYFQGEYDTNGNLLDPEDPLLWWMIPIIKTDSADGPIIADYLMQHAQQEKTPKKAPDPINNPGINPIPGAQDEKVPMP